MKTIKKDDVIRRVKDEEAHQLVKHDGWSYCSKGEWKEKVRGPIRKPRSDSFIEELLGDSERAAPGKGGT